MNWLLVISKCSIYVDTVSEPKEESEVMVPVGFVLVLKAAG